MRFHIPMIAGALFTIAACTTNPVTGVTGIDIPTVQADAVAICSYLPTASVVASIISANNPIAITAEAVAAAICAAVAPKVASKRRKAEPYVYIPPGLVITGNFVR